MKNVIFSLPIILLLAYNACKKENHPAPVSKMYLVEYGFDFPEPPATDWIFYVHGISEIDSMYNVKTIQREKFRGAYRSHRFTLADTTRQNIKDILDKYPQDTSFVFSGNGDPILYGGYYFFLWVERKDNSHNLIDLYMPRNLPEDLKYVYDRLFGDYKDKKLGYLINNEDSLNRYFSRFETYLPENHIARPPVIKWDNMPSFIPPTIDGDDDEVSDEYDGE
ncbi:hypothetical protein GGR21_003537 [Dysgonomonas hofstadii]|uniref:Uncharacterized protein n=1 Tax=Dysgonomonas hofstadii TaxID=637886 RepID=A0A840CNF2_9BACT|nr:hypothetical protein [Dysgonomonas hofstadii]MBB4037617.1 hypothetical protein [Dysgonomonas hofstadii]